MLQQAKAWARHVKRDVLAVWIAAGDPRTPWYAKVIAAGIAAYALSPIDLIPDFIPVLGYLDDLILLPLGILLVVRLIPSDLMAEFREKAAAVRSRPASRAGLAAIIALWLIAAGLLIWLFWPGALAHVHF